jgi:hypothetical protein
MKAKSSEPIAEELRIPQQADEQPTLPAATPEFASPAVTDDVVELFLAELRSRRERLAKWVKLLHAEARLETASFRVAARHRCRRKAGHSADRSAVHRARRAR